MKKLLFWLLIQIVLFVGVANAQTFFSWRQRTHATDCTALTDGYAADLCYEIDDQAFYVCRPALAGTACDTTGEWEQVVDASTLASLNSLVTLSGVSSGSTSLGTFTGTTITDNVTIKAALQEIETAVESAGGAITGSDTHVMFFDGANSPAGEAGMTYNKATDTLTIAGDVIVAGQSVCQEDGTNCPPGSGSGTVQSGVAGAVAKYDSLGTVVNDSTILFDTGTNIGIGTTSPSSTLQVVGSIAVSGTVDGVDVSARDHDSVTLAGTPDYITISGQVITREAVDLGSDVTGNLLVTNLNSGTSASSSTFWRGDGTWAAPSVGSGGSCWDTDGNGDLMPVSTSCTDTLWEEDVNGDLMPQA